MREPGRAKLSEKSPEPGEVFRGTTFGRVVTDGFACSKGFGETDVIADNGQHPGGAEQVRHITSYRAMDADVVVCPSWAEIRRA